MFRARRFAPGFFAAAVGVLKSKQGAGTFVVEADASAPLDSNPLRPSGIAHGFSSTEMFEARLILNGNHRTRGGTRHERASGGVAEELTEMFATLEEPEEYLFTICVLPIDCRRFRQSNPSALMNMWRAFCSMCEANLHRAHDLKESAEVHRQIFRSIREGNTEPPAMRCATIYYCAQKHG